MKKIPKLENIPRSNNRLRCNKCLKNITLGVNGVYVAKLKQERFPYLCLEHGKLLDIKKLLDK